jgi:MarR family transcriptional regulator, organic hydroperoxide resistance regulator
MRNRAAGSRRTPSPRLRGEGWGEGPGTHRGRLPLTPALSPLATPRRKDGPPKKCSAFFVDPVRRGGPGHGEREPTGCLPLTVSRPALLERGSDRRFRQLVYDLLTISVRMERVREHLARRMGISGPQYSVLVAIAQLQGQAGVSVGKVAQVLHVSSAFITMETGRLERLGLVVKAVNRQDRRGVLLRLSPRGEAQIASVSPAIKAINDRFFAPLTRKTFQAFATCAAELVESSREVVEFDERDALAEAAE